ncbi:hypothetical protein GCM10010307_44060 [Streptomyces vastus]|uniref:Secreted protein n=1 Tax=Streptomyces vastus TaxID=285451 RepID=A0ABN3R2A0_9ACTN
MTVNAYRFTGSPPSFVVAASAARAAGAATAPVSATPAPVTADFFRNFRRFNGMSRNSSGDCSLVRMVNNARRF